MQNWDEAQELFYRGVRATGAERNRVLASCDPEVAAFVRRLWVDQPLARSFLRDSVDVGAAAGPVFPKGYRFGGRFTIQDFAGQGGMAEVYRAHDELLGRTVALKAIRANLGSGREYRDHLEREARSICSLTHPGICTLYDLGWDGEQPFLVMEYLSGRTLADRLREGRVKTAEVISIGGQIASALAFAHGKGVLHLDLKPANIMLTDLGVKILDFGIARQALVPGSEAASPAQSGIAGSAAYMSPEQACGRDVDRRTDIFSLGAVLYEMATGTRAFYGDSVLTTMSAVINADPPEIHRIDPTRPKALERIIRRCLNKDRDGRYHDAEDVRRDLGRVVHRSNRVARAGIGALCLVTALGMFLLRPKTSEQAGSTGRGRQLTRDPGVTGDPALSPDGNFVAYASDRDSPNGDVWIWVQPVDGGPPQRLPASCARSASLTFSRDGKSVVYGCATKDGDTELNEVPIVPGQSRHVVQHASGTSFSHDGRRLAVVSNFGELRVLSWPGGSPLLIRQGIVALGRPLWSPTDGALLFSGMAEHDPEIRLWLLNLHDQTVRETALLRGMREHGFAIETAALRFNSLIAWRRRAIYLTAKLKDGSDILRIPVDGELNVNGQPTFVTANAHPGNASVEGSRLAYDITTSVTGLWSVEAEERHGPRGAGATRLAAFETPASGVSRKTGFARGAGLAAIYVDSGAGPGTLYLSDVETGAKQPLTDIARLIWPGPAPSWDGGRLAWASLDRADSVESTVWVSDLTDQRLSVPRPVLHGQNRRPYGWTPDGSGLFFGDQLGHRIYRQNYPANSTDTIIEDDSSFVQCAKVSPDGRWLLFSALGTGRRADAGAHGIYLAPLRGATPVPKAVWRLISDSVTAGNCSYDWSPDGKQVYLSLATEVVSVPRTGESIWDSAAAHVVFRSPPQAQLMQGLFVYRNQVLFVMDEYRSNVWVQELALD